MLPRSGAVWRYRFIGLYDYGDEATVFEITVGGGRIPWQVVPILVHLQLPSFVASGPGMVLVILLVSELLLSHQVTTQLVSSTPRRH